MNPVVAKVGDVLQSTGVHQVFSVELRNGTGITCTGASKFLTRAGFKPLGEIRQGESVGVHKNKLVWWTSVERIEDAGQREIFSLVLEGHTKNFIANGLVVET
jgi:intein/homing endonuclease